MAMELHSKLPFRLRYCTRKSLQSSYPCHRQAYKVPTLAHQHLSLIFAQNVDQEVSLTKKDARNATPAGIASVEREKVLFSARIISRPTAHGWLKIFVFVWYLFFILSLQFGGFFVFITGFKIK